MTRSPLNDQASLLYSEHVAVVVDVRLVVQVDLDRREELEVVFVVLRAERKIDLRMRSRRRGPPTAIRSPRDLWCVWNLIVTNYPS